MLVGNMMDLATGQHTGALAPDEDRAFLVRARSGCPARAKVTDRDVDGDYLAAVEVEWIAEPCATVGITMQVDRTECPGGLFGFPPPYPQIFIEGGWGFLQAGLEPPAFGTFRFAAGDTVLVTAIGPSNAIASFAGDCDEIDGTRCTFTIVDSDRNIVATYRLIPPCNAP